MTLDKIIQTLQIMAKYCDPAKSWVQGEHDIVFLPLGNDVPISDEDVKRLEELGAFRSDEVDCWAFFT